MNKKILGKLPEKLDIFSSFIIGDECDDVIVKQLEEECLKNPELIKKLCLSLSQNENYFRRNYPKFPKFLLAFEKFSLLHCSKHKILDPFAVKFCNTSYISQFIEKLLRSLKKGKLDKDNSKPTEILELANIKKGIWNQLFVAKFHINLQRLKDVLIVREDYFLEIVSQEEISFFQKCFEEFLGIYPIRNFEQ